MSKIKDKLIRALGGYTKDDLAVRCRPVRQFVSHFSIRTITFAQIINQRYAETYPGFDFAKMAKADIAHGIADKMLKEGLIEFVNETEEYSDTKIRGTAKIVVPVDMTV